MSRISGFRGTWQPNQRPYVTLTPDVYVSLQGQTTVIACGQCNSTININSYLTGISTEASTDSPPGSATINLTIPDNDVNNFYVDGQLVIIPMMEVEIFAKGYYLQGGFPQYYRIFWGIVSTITKDWSGGSTTVSIQCKDILRWWEVTNVTSNTALLNKVGSSAGAYNEWQNQFAGMNPYTTIIKLAQESMGDFMTGNYSIAGNALGGFTPPDQGPEAPVIASYMKNIMTYWQYKFANIWTSLKIFGVSGQSYMFTSGGRTVSPVQWSQQIFQSEQALQAQNQLPSLVTVNPSQIQQAKKELVNNGSVEFTQNEVQSKLTVALAARDQVMFEFFMDPSGDIVFKPPFYNLNVIPNKPISWINDFEIIDDSITDTEQEVCTYIVSSGMAFGGNGVDYGLTDEVTAPREVAYDYHLMNLYGFRKWDYSTEWASDPRKLFFHLMDYLDRVNAKRQNGTFTIPMRPELRLGFPVWVPYYDAFFYVTGISHQFSVGGQATTTITVMGKRSKFIAPQGIGQITRGPVASVSSQNPNIMGGNGQINAAGTTKVQAVQNTYNVSFPDNAGANSNLTLSSGDLNTGSGQPIAIRDPKTGILLGYPNAVMVYRNALGSSSIPSLLQSSGSVKSQVPANQVASQNPVTGPSLTYQYLVTDTLQQQQDGQTALALQRLRANRYETGSVTAGNYDYAQDTTGDFIELGILPTTSIIWGAGTQDPNVAFNILNEVSTSQLQSSTQNANQINQQIAAANAAIVAAQKQVLATNQQVVNLQKQLSQANNGTGTTTTGNISNIDTTGASATNAQATSDALIAAQATASTSQVALATAQQNLKNLQAGIGSLKVLPVLNILVRPVSDEFGFEVIGHYRYGRGAYIQNGQIATSLGPNSTTSGTPVNQLSIQFAATAGLTADASTIGSTSSMLNFAAQFDQMQPQDYLTGASFQGGVGPGSNVSNIQFTSSQTYSSNVQQNTGTSVFIEADQSRNSVSLASLTPTIDPTGVLAQAATNCACGLNRSNWLSILPSDFIAEVISTSGTSQLAPIGNFGANTSELLGTPGDGFISSSTPQPAGTTASASNSSNIVGSTGAIIGTATPASFFAVLQKYLSQQFDTAYQQGNAPRELQDTGQSQNVVTQLFNADEQNNILGNPSDTPLLGPASLGDPAALAALQGQVNWNFNQTATALANTAAAFQNGQQQINQALAQASPGGPLISVSASSGSGSTQLTNANIGTSTVATNPQVYPAGIGNVTVTNPAPQVQPVIVQPVPNIAQMILNPSTSTQLANAQFNAIPGSGGAPGLFPPYQDGVSGPPTKTGQG